VDVYSLGANLYELVTGQPPFQAENPLETLVQVLEQEPARPRALNPALDRDLETICLKCLEKEPHQRYDSAAALADDLESWQAGEPIRARPIAAWERSWRWMRRRPAVAGLLLVSGVATLALVGAVVALVYNTRLGESNVRLQEAYEETQQARQIAEVEGQRAQVALAESTEARKQAEHYKYFHHIALAQAEWRASNLARAESLLEDCAPDQRQWEWRYLKRLCHADLLTLQGLQGRTALLRGLAFSPDGIWLVSDGVDRTVRVWDATTGRLLKTLEGHTRRVLAVTLSPDGTRLATASADGTVKIWDTRTDQVLTTLESHQGLGPWSVAFSADGRRLATGDGNGNASVMRIWDTATWKEICEPKVHAYGVVGLAFHPGGTQLASSGGRTVRVWDTTTWEELRRPLEGHKANVWSLAYSPGGTILASASWDGSINLWDAATGQLIRSFESPTTTLLGLQVSPNGAHLAAAGSDGIVRIWSLATGKLIQELRGHTLGVCRLAFSPDGTRLASASEDQTIKIWDVTLSQESLFQLEHSAEVQRVAFSPNGSRLISASWDNNEWTWDMTTAQLVSTSPTDQVRRTAKAFSPDGRWRASATDDNTVKVWDVQTGQEFRTLRGHTGKVFSVFFSPDGKRLASASGDKTMKVWDVQTGQELLTLEGPGGYDDGVAFSPDGHRLASGSKYTVKIWDTTTGQLALTLIGHRGLVQGIAFHPDGARLATGSADGTVKIWDTTTGQLALTLTGHQHSVRGVAFSPDGTRLASASEDRTVRVWDARPWTPETAEEAALERETLGLLEFLVRKPLRKADVEQYLRSSPLIRPQAKQRALALVDHYRQETDPGRYHAAAWDVVRQPYLNAFQYRFALLQAQTACQLAPEQVQYQTALGAAQYRVGQFREALATLMQADSLHQAVPANLAFRVMTQHRLGQKEQAQAALARLRLTLSKKLFQEPDEPAGLSRRDKPGGSSGRALERVSNPEWANGVEAQALLGEAEALLHGSSRSADP
jgi:WD40 repeat protein